MKWRNVGTSRPLGFELTNRKLSEALAAKTEFTQSEWLAFGIDRVQFNNFVRSGDSYFAPVATKIFDADTEHAL